MSGLVAGTFANGGSVAVGMRSEPLVIPTDCTVMYLTLGGAIDASNTVKTRKSTNNGLTWSDVTTYNSAQNGTAVTVAGGEQWIVETVAGQALKEISYKLSCESTP